MDFSEYQRQAARTDKILVPDGGDDLMVPLLGLGGEAGSLLTEYKKRLRDGPAHSRFAETVAEELGDVLWYAAAIATKMQLDLGEIAMSNIAKARDRWSVDDDAQVGLGFEPPLPDEAFRLSEQFPRTFRFQLVETVENGRKTVRPYMDGVRLGDKLTDNAYDDDGYRYHDAFHLAYVAILGWSPVIRKLMRRKRESDSLIDEVEDGGRAQVIEEGVAAYVYEYAKKHAFLKGVTTLDYDLLRTVRGMTSELEVSRRTPREWERAILAGFEVWNGLVRCRTGTIAVDMRARTIVLEPE